VTKIRWLKLIDEYPTFRMEMKRKFLQFYFREVLKPVLRSKRKDIARFQRRNDFDQMLMLKDNYDKEIQMYYTVNIKD